MQDRSHAVPVGFQAAWAPWLVIALGFAALAALVAFSPPRPIHDEAWFLDTVRLLRRDGLTRQFLRDFPGAAGPTFTLVFATVDSVFGLSFPWLRLVNGALLAATALLIGRCLAITQRQDAALIGAMLTLLPTAGVSAGLALTEMPAAFFAVVAIVLLGECIVRRGAATVIYAMLGGVALAAAILGRQNYLLLLPCLLLAIDRASGLRVVLVAAVAIMIVMPVFMLWGGLVPPRTAWSTSGLAPGHVLRGAGYAGLIMLLLAPQIYAPLLRHRLWLAAIALLSVPPAFMRDGNFVPMRTAMRMLFDDLTPIAWGAAYALSVAALSFAVCFTLHLWRHRDQWLTRVSGSFVLLGLLSNAKITHQFSSRYVFVVLPFMVIAAAPAIRVTRWTPIQMTSAAGISLAALASYYFAR